MGHKVAIYPYLLGHTPVVSNLCPRQFRGDCIKAIWSPLLS